MPRHDQLDALAKRQHGLVTRAQVTGCGWSEASLYRMERAGRLERVRLGVYRLCGVPVTWRSTALAAVLAAGPDAVLSHRSAGALWGVTDHHGLGSIEITQPQPCRQPGVVTHRRLLDRRDRAEHDRIPVTTPERTLIDLGTTHPIEALGELVDQALRRRLTSIPKLRTALDRVPLGGRNYRLHYRMGAVLSTRGSSYDPGANPWEQKMDLWFERSGLPPSRRQYRVQVDGHRYKLDRAIPELRIAIEWIGRESHGTRSQFEYDSERRNRLQAAGWRVLEFHHRSDPAMIIRTVEAVCQQQRRHLGLDNSASASWSSGRAAAGR